MKPFFLGILFCSFLFSCNNHKVEQVERAFYYWKSNGYQFSQFEDSITESLKVNKLYLKFFEVEHDETLGNIPFSKTDLRMYNNQAQRIIVPTIYLKNEIFIKSSKSELDTLADNIHFLIQKNCRDNFKLEKKVTEYQMDCDWTLKSKDNYFYFLKALKTISKKEISCTLRLYPYKYRTKMGIPPVDKVMLMCYNLINPLSNKNKNSILDLEEFKSYLTVEEKYPIHLDVALPTYSWMHLYRNNNFLEISYANINDTKKVLKPIKPMWYEVVKDTIIGESYFRVGDKLKIEETTTETIQNAIQLLKKHTPLDSKITVSLFHLDEQQLINYNNEEISSFYNGFIK